MKMYVMVEIGTQFAGDIFAANDFDTMLARLGERKRKFERDLIGAIPASSYYNAKKNRIAAEEELLEEVETYRHQQYGFFDICGGQSSWLLMILDSERLD